jgi:uncharacterized BrkB/YihY/UPF0761 family membrane protein
LLRLRPERSLLLTRLRAFVGELPPRVEDLASRVPVVRAGMDWWRDDREVGGSILTAALALRLFLLLLPISLLSASALGFAQHADEENVSKTADQFGLGGLMRTTMDTTADQAQQARWITLILGVSALVTFGWSTLKAIRQINALAWRTTAPKLQGAAKAFAVFLGIVVLALLVSSGAAKLRTLGIPFRVGGALFSVVAWTLLWFLVSALLPHDDAPLSALLPGSLVVGIGTVGMHLVMVFYVARKLESSSELYGALGAAAALLGGLLILARLLVISATLNASLWHRKRLHRLHATWGWVTKPTDLWRRDKEETVEPTGADAPERDGTPETPTAQDTARSLLPLLDTKESERPT